MKTTLHILCASVLTLLTFDVLSQGAPGALPQTAGPNFHESDSPLGMNPDEARKIAEYVENSKTFNRSQIKNVPPKDQLMSQAKELISILNVECTIKDVDLGGQRIDTVAGKMYLNNLYEVSCAEGTGFLLNSHAHIRKEGAKPDKPTAGASFAMSCMSADRIHDDDIKNGGQSEFYCHLPDNGGGDLRVIGSRLLALSGVDCKVTQFKWFGMRAESKTEFSEASCENGQGYLVQTQLPGTSGKPSVMNCNDAIQKGIECRMTPVIKPVTLETFVQYLASTSVNCKVTSTDQVKVLGRENTKQRYVVEFKCEQQPNGLVAFIPLNDNTNVFETHNCKEIKAYGIKCKMTLE